MKKKVINTMVCDARNLNEESLSEYESITVNAALVLTDAESRAVMERYPLTLNASSVIDVPEDLNIRTKVVNGKFEIGPETDGEGIFLIVNGKLTLREGSIDAANSFYRILINGKALIPKSYMGAIKNLTENGKTVYYPDGAVILKPDTQLDDMFIMRASSKKYYVPGRMFILDEKINTSELINKDITLSADKVIIAKSLVSEIVPRIDEESEIITVPDGTKLINEEIELKDKIIRKYGNKLCVLKDVSIEDREALSQTEYLMCTGTVSVTKELSDMLYEKETALREVNIIDKDIYYVNDQVEVKVTNEMLMRMSGGLSISDGAVVYISEDVSSENIREKLRIKDCAVVYCSEAQDSAVRMVSEDVAAVLRNEEKDEDEDYKNSKVINASECHL